MTDKDIERLLRDALAAEPSAKADAAVREAIVRAAAANAANPRRRAPWRKVRFAGVLRRVAPPLLAASFAVAAILHFDFMPRHAAGEPGRATPDCKTAHSAATNSIAASQSGLDAVPSDDAAYVFDEGDFMLEITSMSDGCLLIGD